MAAQFVVQNDDGDEAGANAYLTLAEFKQYHENRGNALNGATDPDIQTAIVRASDYVDQRFAFPGRKLIVDPAADEPQTTEWPRYGVYHYSYPVEGIPVALKNAVAEYALRALSATLFADAPPPEDGREILKSREKVDVIETEVEYAPGGGSSAALFMPAYPPADLMLMRAGLITSPGLVR